MSELKQHMEWSHWRLRLRILVPLLIVAFTGVLTFLLVGSLVALSALSAWAPANTPEEILTILLVSALVAIVVSTAVALVAGRWLFVRLVTPVRGLTTLARHLARGHYTDRTEDHLPQPDDEDMTALAGAMDELAGALEAAERRRILSFGEIAHEIRAPVAVLEGYMEGLLDGHVKPNDRTWAILHDEASRMHRLVDEMQELARAEARQAPPELQAIDPSAIAQAALDRLRLHFSEKGLTLVSSLPKGLPLALADRDQALQALVNMLTNALRYTPVPGQVTVSVGLLEESNEVLFQVTDTGVGIAAEHIPHLFERFFRVDRSTSRKAGQGIGLPVAKALVEAMGGRIWAESPGLGKGSTFSFTLLMAGGGKA